MSVKATLDLLADGGAIPVGCRISHGQLLPALTCAACEGDVPSSIIYGGYSEGTGRYFLCTPTEIHVSGNGEDFIKMNSLTGDYPFLIEDIDGGKPRAVVVSKTFAVAHTGSSFKNFSYGASLSCGVMHCGRLFGADYNDGYKLCWSGEGGVGDREEGIYGSGSLELDSERGVILNILEFGEKLVLVRKYGLTLLSMYGMPENFSVEMTDTGCDEVWRNTAQTAGGKLLFYTVSGLYSFDGSRISNVVHRLSKDISTPVCSAVCGSKYYLSCTSKSLGGRTVLCYDVEDGESYFIDACADAMCISDKFYAYNPSGSYRLQEGGKYCFTSAPFDFATPRRKTVTGIEIDCDGADVEISNGRLTRRFSDVKGIIKPKLRGKRFTVKVTGDVPVRALKVTAEVCNAI